MCRDKGLVEGKLWTIAHVEELLAAPLPPVVQQAIKEGVLPSFKIARVDEQKPWLPSNAKLVV